MPLETYRDLEDGRAFDFAVVGSGFGGSVCALRLAEKGYAVAVLEAGRHFRDEDFARSNWDLSRFLWLPRLFLQGILRLTWLKDMMVLSGAGVGGGSLVYANVLMEPGEAFYQSPECRRLAPDLAERLKIHFQTAKRMLGVASNPRLFPADEALKECAAAMGLSKSFQPVPVGVYFGKPGENDPDPYFGGEGPERSGCLFCGACMVGCRHNAKNTLVKNYLHFALKKGVSIYSLTTVESLHERGIEGFELVVKRSGWGWGRKRLFARNLVLSAGVLGTLRLLLEPKNTLRLPPRVGRDVRTNSEAILGTVSREDGTDYSEGIAIGSCLRPDADTQIQAVRYPAGSDAMSLLSVPDTPGGSPWLRPFRLLGFMLTRPRDVLRLLPFGWAKRATILLVMQSLDSRLRLVLKKTLGITRLASRPEPGSRPPPREIPVAAEVLRRLCSETNAVPVSSWAGAFLNMATTAHILGGAAMGRNPEEGVADLHGRVFGHQRLWVADGSLIPANLGVNPALTITALAEHAMSSVAPKADDE